MDDTISRQAAIDVTWEEPTYTDPINVLTDVRDRIKALPLAQPEREKGAWIATYSDCGANVYVTWKCCNCGYVRKKGWEHTDAGEKPDAQFCEACGADMRGEQND